MGYIRETRSTRKSLRGGTGNYAKERRKLLMEHTGGDTRKLYRVRGTAHMDAVAHARRKRRHTTRMR